ncbi:MAG: ABC transporter permease [Bacilli bacterium]|jgi:spermidine/putrescine transport system permease protein|nr:ABC transporter permease [Bacilli bacterium]MDD3421939.1 ABC transporter permease [Bacilli bacterium]MDD4065405.1 ABC transporter permease [Bacilli bacterium]
MIGTVKKAPGGRSPLLKQIKAYIKRPKTALERFKLLGIPYYLILLVLVIIPMILILFYAITTPNKDDAILLTLNNFIAFFQEEGFVGVLWDSIRISGITTIVTLLIAYPLAYIICDYKLKKQALIILLVSAPMWVNMLLRTIAWKQILSTAGPLNAALGWLFGMEPINFLGTDFAVVLGMVYIFLPFMVIPIYNNLSKIDNRLIEASLDLGASRKYTFFKVTLPLSLPGVLSGVTMVLLPSATTLVVPRFLGEGRYFLIGNLIEQKFLKSGLWNYGAAISIILVVVLFIILFLTKKVDRFHKDEEDD